MTALEICNQALYRLGETQLEEGFGGVQGPRFQAIYQTTLEAALRSHRWNFAMALPVLLSAGTEAGRWALPLSCVRLCGLAAGTATEARHVAEYALVGREVATLLESGEALYAAFVSAAVAVDFWDATFREAFVARLAAKFSEVTRGNTSVRAEFNAEAEMLFTKARRIDANETGKRRLRGTGGGLGGSAAAVLLALLRGGSPCHDEFS